MSNLAPSFLSVRRTARFYAIGEPQFTVRDLWIACHGFSQLARSFAEPFERFRSDTRMILVPEALNRFYVDSTPEKTATSEIGATWMTREDREHDIADIVTYLDILYEWAIGELAKHGVGRDAVRVHALGFSQGASAVARWTARGEAIVDHLVIWGMSIPEDVNLRALAERSPGLEVDIAYGKRDKWVKQEMVDAQRAVLEGSGVKHSIRAFDGGHSLNSAMLGEIIGA